MSNGPNRVLDELAKLMTDAAGAAQGMRKEAETAFRAQAERILNKMDVVQREEFEVVKDIATKARTEVEELKKRLDALEKKAGTPS
ncbi:MAG: accessory factor UbiK family protein [Bartonella sp.]|nr:accessory factor UbiK family protein [Bartonella sp.]